VQLSIADCLPDLLRREAYPHPSADRRLIETHISWVILAGAFAYKLRKPVNFGFLDFTTLDKRRADCEAEVELNRRLCPDIYLGVVDITERDGRLQVGGPGRVVEPAVKMRRLPEHGMLPALIARGAADERLMRRLAAQVSEFHARAPRGPDVDRYATVSALHANWEENFTQTDAFVQRTIDTAVRDDVRTSVEGFLAQHRELLERRVREGRICDGHGDLHAGSVCLSGRRLYLFDCIEFNARFRCADVAAEVAFLAMDLDHLGRADLGHAFVDAYVHESGDSDLPRLLSFYKSYRAYVRGKVRSFRLDEPGGTAADAAEATAYFDLAHAYARGFPQPLLVVAMGLPASGKSTIARALAGRLGLVHLSSDVVRKQLAGLRPAVHHYEPFEHGLYSRAMSRRTYAALRRLAARWLRRGQSVVLDATYGTPAQRVVLRQLARHAGAALIVVQCVADERILRERLAAREGDPNTTSDARLELWPALRARFTPPTELRDVVVLDTTLPLEQTITHLLARLRGATPADSQAA
jgi:aminoglycoside phosphotransferase family enzyme/predicted kinase